MGSDGLAANTELLAWPPQQVFSKPLVLTSPLPQCEVCIIVPVRNEAENLEATLTALAYQTDLQGQPFNPKRYEIILLANNCCDDSAAIAQRFAEQHPALALHVVEITLPRTQAYIGRVRKILMDEAYCRLTMLGRRHGVIASTDGDTQVAPTWIAANLYEIACGVDAVGGRILTEHAGRHALDPITRSYYLREVGYRYLVAELETYLDNDPYDPWPRHYQHFGASLAVTAQMYEQAGGLPPVRTPEDVAFYRALVRANVRFRHSPLVRVRTSARKIGRTNLGLANQLSEWAAMGSQNQPFLVESAAAIETRLRGRHGLRMLWWRFLNGYQPTFKDITPLANDLEVAAGWLMQELMLPHTFGLLIERIEQHQQAGDWIKRWPLVDIKQAISDLRLRLDCLRREPSSREDLKTSPLWIRGRGAKEQQLSYDVARPMLQVDRKVTV
jgi:hypothetical protein